jgi:hypothetical protein
MFDFDAGPVTITLPDAGKRFMSMQVIDEDQHTQRSTTAPAATRCHGKRWARAINLAASDVHYLSHAVREHYSDGSNAGVDDYSDQRRDLGERRKSRSALTANGSLTSTPAVSFSRIVRTRSALRGGQLSP